MTWSEGTGRKAHKNIGQQTRRQLLPLRHCRLFYFHKMFSHYEKGYKAAKPDMVVDITTLARTIRDNPKKALIAKLRRCSYKSEEYDKIKEMLPCVTPAGMFGDERKTEKLIQLSQYIFYDVDGLENIEAAELVKNDLVKKYTDTIALCGISSGGRGLFFYIRVDGLSGNNYNEAFDWIAKNRFGDVDIDFNAKGISRAHIIPHDPNLYFNPMSEAIVLPSEVTKPGTKKETVSVKKNRGVCFMPSVSFYGIDQVITSISQETKVDVRAPVFDIEGIPYHKLYIPLSIADGRKHTTFRALTQSIVYLNPGVSLRMVQSFINYVNYNHTTRPMNQREMERTIAHEYDRIHEAGGTDLEPPIKVLHFNKSCGLSKERKTMIASMVNGLIKVFASVSAIEKARETIESEGRKMTKKEVARLSGVSLKTVSRHWDKRRHCIAEEIAGIYEHVNGEPFGAHHRPEIVNK